MSASIQSFSLSPNIKDIDYAIKFTKGEHNSLLNDFAHWLKKDKEHYVRLDYDDWCKLKDFLTNHEYDEYFIKYNEFDKNMVRIYGKNLTTATYANIGPFELNDNSFGTFLYETFLSKKETIRFMNFIDSDELSIPLTGYNSTINCSNMASTIGINDNYGTTITNWTYANEIEEIKNKIKEIKNEIKENNKMETSKIFGKFDFGKVSGDKVRMSPYGLAVKNTDGTWVAYDATAGAIMNVDVFNFDGSNFLYKVPVAINQVAVGDIVVHNRAPKFVKTVNDDTLVVVDIVSGEIATILPTKSPFGFNFITKIMNLLGNFTANADNPFGNMLPFMLMGDSNTNDMLPFIMMMNGGQFDMSNPLMLYALMGKGNNDMLPFLLMNSIGNTSANGDKTNA